MLNYSIIYQDTPSSVTKVFFSDLKLRTFLKLSNQMSIFLTEVKLDEDFKKSYTDNLGQSSIWITFGESILTEEDVFLNICVNLNVICKSAGISHFPVVQTLIDNKRLSNNLTTVFIKLTNKISNGQSYEEHLISCCSKIYFFLEHYLRLP